MLFEGEMRFCTVCVALVRMAWLYGVVRIRMFVFRFASSILKLEGTGLYGWKRWSWEMRMVVNRVCKCCRKVSGVHGIC